MKSGYHTEEFYRDFWSTIKSGKPWRGMYCIKTKSGNLIWLDSFIEPIFDEENKIKSFIGVRLNVTDQVQNAATLAGREKTLADISKFAAIGELSAFIAHEINNPLTVMKLALSSLESVLSNTKPDLDKARTLNGKINRISDRIAKIIATLSNLARNESLLKMQPNKFNDILDDSVMILEDLAKTIGTKLIIENNIDGNLSIKCHRTQISQVLVNIIKNACDAVLYVDADKREVKITANLVKECLEIKVMDSGSRIPDHVAINLFTPYYTTKSEGKGTGIGLTMSAQIIESHGGKIFLDRECENTCFTIILPLKSK
jgi:C4-dicarboxylate-specific signal transduction histidine kinase